VNLGTILWYSASLAEAAVIGLLLYRRVWRKFPVFFVYSLWNLFVSVGAYLILRGYSPHSSVYTVTYITATLGDAALLFGVLVELAWSILRPVHSSLPRRTLIVIAGLIFVVGAAIWPFANFPGAARLSPALAGLAHLQQTFSILRVVVFLVLAGGSQVLSIGWRDRELQIATGLGFNSLVGLAVAMLRMHESSWAQYTYVNQFVVASYLCSLFYWIVSFAQQEEERKEFTPQMQSMLLAVAGVARTSRVALSGPISDKSRKSKP